MLYWNTVTDLLKDCLIKLMAADEFSQLRLVGGTALSLHLGHRMSVDIDLFADAALYGKMDFDIIEQYLINNIAFVQGDFGSAPAMGKSYLIGPSKDELVKLDIYYTTDPFFQPYIEEDGIRLATIEEIIAMKVDIIGRTGRKKDFWDLHELLKRYSIADMIALHELRYEWTHNRDELLTGFGKFEYADRDFDPICLKGKQWAFIKDDFAHQMNRIQ